MIPQQVADLTGLVRWQPSQHIAQLVSCEALASEVEISIPDTHLIRTFTGLIQLPMPPQSVGMGNIFAVRSHDFAKWATARGIALNCIHSDEPNQSGKRPAMAC